MEEQKPTDLLLLLQNEEIKLEEPFDEEVVERKPNPDDKHSELIMPKTEEFDDQYSSASSKVVNHFVHFPPQKEPKLEEPIEKPLNVVQKFYVSAPRVMKVQNILPLKIPKPRAITWSQQEPKLEKPTEKPLNVIQKFYGLAPRMMKVQNILPLKKPDPVTITWSQLQEQRRAPSPYNIRPLLFHGPVNQPKPFPPQPKPIPMKKIAPPKPSRICALCSEPHPNAKFVRKEEEKLIIMLGCILCETFSMEEAQTFMEEGTETKLICRSHFVLIPCKIFQFLEVISLRAIPTSPILDELMGFVNTLLPNTSIEMFIEILERFCEKNRYASGGTINPLNLFLRKKRQVSSALKQTHNRIRCSICLYLKFPTEVRDISPREDKLIIIIGSVLRGESTIDRAKRFTNLTVCTHACHHHTVNAISEVKKALKINSVDELMTCSVELMNELMTIVNGLLPTLSTSHFFSILQSFVAKNQYLQKDVVPIRGYIPPPTVNLPGSE